MSSVLLIEAIQRGDRKLAQELLLEDPDLALAHTVGGVPVVLLALYYGEPELAQLMVQQGAPVTIFAAAALGDLERARTLLADDPALCEAVAPDGFTPLGLASFFGHTDIVALLLDQGADPNHASHNVQEVAPLHSAAAGRHLEIARMLINRGADVLARQAGEFTPLHSAAQNGQIELVELLLEHGADTQATSARGQTPLDLAHDKGHTAVVERLRR